MDNLRAEVLEYSGEGGAVFYAERLENALGTREIDHDERKVGCLPCKKFGKNLACPPYSPSLPEYIKDCRTAKVICFRIPLEQFPESITEERYRTGFDKVRGFLADDLLRYRRSGRLVAGSGTCLACERCAIESGKNVCKSPSKRIYSLESLGVSVVSLTEKAFGFKLEWSACLGVADFVSAVGAVFYR
jgi:predicted metal-binding protein